MVDHKASLSNLLWHVLWSSVYGTKYGYTVMRYASYVMIYGIDGTECVIRMTHAVILQSWATEVNDLQSFARRRRIQSEVKYEILVASFGRVGRGGNEARGNQPYAYICDSVKVVQ